MSNTRSLVAVATDRSPGGTQAVEWAAQYARSLGADLLAIQVVGGDEDVHPSATASLETSLPECGGATRAAVVASDEIAEAIVAEAHRAGADVLVIGNEGMAGRKEFLLGNVANRVTHLARCTVTVVNTSASDTVDAEPGTEGTERASDSRRGRAAEIARALGPILARQLSGTVLRHEADPDGPRQLREALEELGPTFSKLGQILSTRPDLVSAAFIDELSSLRDDVPPLTEAEVVAVMEQELGVPWEDAFSSIDPEPLAAGTIGQVHRARLVDGRRVVVKVQRPSAAELVERDLDLFEAAVRPLERSRRARRVVDVPSLVDQLGGALRAELDFRLEADHLDRMAEVLTPFSRVDVPSWHRELSTRRLLVMDEIVDGVPVRDAPAGPERDEAARQLLHAYFRQVLDEGFFHADPHPGNLLWADDTIWLLDLGMVGTLDGDTRRRLMLVLLAFSQGDVDLLADVTLELSGAETIDVDVDAYRDDLARLVGEVSGRSLREIHLVEILDLLTSISVRHGVPLPHSIVLVGKALGQVQLTVAELAPDLDPIDEAGRYFLRSVSERIAGSLDPQRLVYEAERLRYRVSQISEGLATVLGNRPGRRLEIAFSSQRLERTIARSGVTVGLAFGAGLTWVATTVAASSDRASPRLARGLGALATALSAGFAADVVRRR